MGNPKDRQTLAWEGMFYSVQRIDLLIISICGAGIYVCLESLKYFYENKLDSYCLIKLAGAFFLLGIVTNFLSQIFGYKTHEQDYLMCEYTSECGENPTEEEKDLIRKYDLKSDFFSNLTSKFNYASIASMFIALIMLFILIAITF